MMMDVAEVEKQPASPGQMLRAAREAKGWKVEQVASQLKLSRRQIEALEADAFADLPGLTFVRGFVRNYARVLEQAAISTGVDGAWHGQRHAGRFCLVQLFTR